MSAARAMLEAQLKELDAIEKEAVTQSMNTVRGAEEVHKWKARTVALIAQRLGPAAAKSFADTKPGPSFTNDLFEELSDEVELYRQSLRALIKSLPPAQSA
jgi:hypothetical protein